MDRRATLSPFSTGLKGRCVRCGQGSVFSGFLTFAPACANCGERFDVENAGDGPAVFVIFIVGIVIIPLALAFQLVTNAPLWLTMLIWIPVIIAACLGLLRPLRGLMLNLQIAHEASEVRAEDIKDQQ